MMSEVNEASITKYNKNRPEIVDQYKTLGRRIYAGMIDASIAFVFMSLVVLILQLVDSGSRFALYRIVGLVFGILFPVILTKVFGGTPGKLYFNLVVKPVNADGRITWLQSILRESINIVSNVFDLIPVYIFFFLMNQNDYKSFLAFENASVLYSISSIFVLCVFLLEIATAALSQKRRSVHDFLAGTVVVKIGPYRKWSNFIAIGMFVIAVLAQIRLYNFIHN